MLRSITNIRRLLAVFAGCLVLAGCAAGETVQEQPAEEGETAVVMTLLINDTPVEVIWEDNDAVSALRDHVQEEELRIDMSMYGGFEQVGTLGFDVPRSDTRITTEPGDIVLYQGNQIVVFYGSNTWGYTKLGHITDKSDEELKQLLGNGDVLIVLSAEEDA
ncbi:MAG: hypothetical protein IKF51_01930 [Solobacterium sp.]|nr:hypothetical protein [Solobacterium sp.]